LFQFGKQLLVTLGLVQWCKRMDSSKALAAFSFMVQEPSEIIEVLRLMSLFSRRFI